MNTGFHECDLDELHAVTAGFFSNFAALNPQPIPPGPAPHFAEHVRKWLIEWADENDYDIYADGLIVHTTIDSSLQDAAAQAVEHYEISRYGTLKAWAEELGLDDAAELLQETLDEEEATDEALTEIAKSAINQQAKAA